jgi:hypothetical protein
MLKKLLLNKKEFHVTVEDLPILIHGKNMTGSSLFTVSLVADLYNQGSKIFFLSGYHMARDEFLEQTNNLCNGIFLTSNTETIPEVQKKRIIFIRKEDPDWFIKVVQVLSDIEERVILVKNIDLFPEEVFDAVVNKSKLIISGDIDKCSYRDKLISKSYSTKILFSKPKVDLGVTLPFLKQYEGYLSSKNETGVVSLQM